MPCFANISGPTHPGHYALRYELTTMKSSSRGRGSREERRRRPQKFKGPNSTDGLDTINRSNDDSRREL